MANGGFFLGGMASGMSDAAKQSLAEKSQADTNSIQKQTLSLAQQHQGFVEQQTQIQQVQKQIDGTMQTVSELVKAASDAGHDLNSPAVQKAVSPLIESAASLAQRVYGPDGAARIRQQGMALVTAARQPVTPNIPGITSTAQPANPNDVSGTPSPPGQNITSGTVTGVQYGPVTGNAPATPPAPPQENPVDMWTKALMQLPKSAPPAQMAAIKARLTAAINASGDNNIDVKVLRGADSSQHVVFVDKATKQIFGPNGEPYVPDAVDTDIKDIANAIESGKQPPVTTGMYRRGAALKAQLAKDNFDLTQANLQWTAAQKQIASLNGSQMVRYAGLANSVVNTINETNSLAEQLQNSGVPLANKAKLMAYMQTAGNSPSGQLAAKYIASINTLKEEFANLAQGGFAPTEAVWSLANQQINADYGVKQLSASLKEVQRLIRYRLNGIPNFSTLGPGAPNQYTGGAKNPAPAASTAAAPKIPAPPEGFVVTGGGR